MDRVFLDANVLFSAAYHASSQLQRLWELKRVELLTSAYAAEEARRNLTETSRQARLAALLDPVKLVSEPLLPILPAGVELPAKDHPILLAAIQARATHLLTGDRTHFGKYLGQRVAGVLILRPAEYLRGRHHR